MSSPDPLLLAQEQINALTAEIVQLRKELKAIHGVHESRIERMKAQHQAELELARGTGQAAAQIAGAKAAAEVAIARAEVQSDELTRQTEYERLEALLNELTEEISVLCTFSRENAVAFYTARVERDRAELARAEERRTAAKKARNKAKHRAQSSGSRNVAEMATIDANLALASAEFQEADLLRVDAQERLADSERKLSAARG